MQVDRDAQRQLSCPIYGADEVRLHTQAKRTGQNQGKKGQGEEDQTYVLTGDVWLRLQHVDRPVADRDPDMRQTGVLDVNEVVPGVECPAEVELTWSALQIHAGSTGSCRDLLPMLLQKAQRILLSQLDADRPLVRDFSRKTLRLVQRRGDPEGTRDSTVRFSWRRKRAASCRAEGSRTSSPLQGTLLCLHLVQLPRRL